VHIPQHPPTDTPARARRIAGALRIRLERLIEETIEREARCEHLDRLLTHELEAWAYAARTARQLADHVACLERRPEGRAAA
jgi:hypothetical protein